MKQITVTNPTRRRSWGWGWSCTPTGEGPYSIERPAEPDYTGTIDQVRRRIRADRTYAGLKSGGTFTREQWFWKGRPVSPMDMDGLISEIGFRREFCEPPLEQATICLID